MAIALAVRELEQINRMLEALGINPKECQCTGMDVRIRINDVVRVRIYAHATKKMVEHLGNMIVEMADADRADTPFDVEEG